MRAATAVHAPVPGTLDLRTLSPFETMDDDFLAKVRRRAVVRDCVRGEMLFREGERNEEVSYVLTGQVELRRDERRVYVVAAGEPEARFPLSKGVIHWHSAEVVSRHAQILTIDAERLDVLLTLEQTGSYKVLDLQRRQGDTDSDDWMVQMLRSGAFARIPPSNIQTMFMRLQRVDRAAGDVIIKQGDEGDYFYVIVSGSCVVTRDKPTGGAPLKLAELGIGATFGEEALISGSKRNANVCMVADGTLMRLERKDFCKLFSDPVTRSLQFAPARQLIADGGLWIDVRLPSEFANSGLPGAVNIPLYMLRLRMETLPRGKPLVVYCDTGRRSSVAAFILAQHELDVAVLQGGIDATTPDFSSLSGMPLGRTLKSPTNVF